jgi:hypothetical protein
LVGRVGKAIQDANEKKRYAAMLEDGLRRKLPTQSKTEANLRAASKQRARRANRSVEQKTAETT